jgi:hypothetical protein
VRPWILAALLCDRPVHQLAPLRRAVCLYSLVPVGSENPVDFVLICKFRLMLGIEQHQNSDIVGFRLTLLLSNLLRLSMSLPRSLLLHSVWFMWLIGLSMTCGTGCLRVCQPTSLP